MQPVEILKDLYFIERGFLNANHFVYRSENPILIDTAYIADFDETAGATTSGAINVFKINPTVILHCIRSVRISSMLEMIGLPGGNTLTRKLISLTAPEP
jgi:hypothetical protein